MVAESLDSDGVYPHICVCQPAEGKLEVQLLYYDYSQVIAHCAQLKLLGATEIMFGVDRTTKEGQGTEFKDVLTCGHWQCDNGWRIAVLNYQYEPRILRDFDWDNAFWSAAMLEEIQRYEKQIEDLAKQIEQVLRGHQEDENPTEESLIEKLRERIEATNLRYEL